MPYYPHVCVLHGLFESFRPMARYAEQGHCPECGRTGHRLISLPAIRFVNRERLEYGSESPGRVVSHKETGGMSIYIPSDGALEQNEVDYVAEGAIEKERGRVAKQKGPRSDAQARIQDYAALALSQPRGQRAKAIKEAVAESGDRLVNYRG
ncbi:hypothetical protein LCGC14_1391220 [marine sediment metagenome]|uniref:Putative regulatory protein FmdB zinc ribbon domain-containing protein n=1 Tax=marine sediment metagenome TaxID=412755 RepID=A0A0F9JZY3_9ZZZZ